MRIIPLGIVIIGTILMVIFHFLKIEPLRDYFYIFVVTLLPETIWRIFHKITIKNNRIVNILVLREENLNNLLKEIVIRGKLKKDDKERILRLTENSLAMISIVIALIFSLIIIPISYEPIWKIKIISCHINYARLEIFFISGFVTFILMIFVLALCYSSIVPDIPDKILVNVAKRYYFLMLYSVSLLGITIIYGIYTFLNISSSLLRKILIFLFIGLLILYFFIYIFKVPVKNNNSDKFTE